MATIPVDVNEACIVSVVLDDGFLGDLESVLVLVGAIS
jgi:hypothetical protein